MVDKTWLWRWWVGISPGGSKVQLVIHDPDNLPWSKVTINMTPDQARKLIAALVEAADAAEPSEVEWFDSA